MSKVYMNTDTGVTGGYDDWAYENEAGEQVNAVDLGEVVEVIKRADGEWIGLGGGIFCGSPGP